MPYNLPPGVQLRDVEPNHARPCDGCGRLFESDDEEQSTCPRCQNSEDQDE